MDLYFQRHDGQAVTTDDFAQAMQDAGGVDLAQFRRWYDQAGTPVVRASGRYDAAAHTYALTLEQSCQPTPGQPEKLPLHIPFGIGLVDAQGADIPLRLEHEAAAGGTSRVLSLTQAQQRFTFVDVRSEPVPSLLRGFSAPVIVKHEYSDDALAHLLAHDSDPFNRWEAGQRLAVNLLLRAVAAQRTGHPPEFPGTFASAFAKVLTDAARDPALAAEALALPSESYIAEQMDVVHPDAVHAARTALRQYLARTLRGELLAAYQAFAVPGPYSPDARPAGQRALKNLCLSYLMELPEPPALDPAAEEPKEIAAARKALAVSNVRAEEVLIADLACAEVQELILPDVDIGAVGPVEAQRLKEQIHLGSLPLGGIFSPS
jgi:aminopeptidase N